MKKLIAIILTLTMVITTLAALTSCNFTDEDFADPETTAKEENANNNDANAETKTPTYVAIDAVDLIAEDFGIAVKKGNTTLLNMVNEVVNAWVADGTMAKYVDYYDAIANGETPDADGLKTAWDFTGATETITVYTESGFAPFEFISDNEIIGVDIAIMSEVAEKNGMKIEVKDVAFDTITTCVKTADGYAVGAAGLTINEERKAEVDFSDIYYSSTLVVVSSSDKKINSVKDLSGLKVGVQEGTSGDLIISDAKAGGYTFTDYDENDNEIEVTITVDGKTTIKQYKAYALAFADLKAGRIDAILMDKLPAQIMLANAGN